MSMKPKSPQSSRNGFTVTPSDTDNLTSKGIEVTAKALYVGSAGNVKVKRAGGSTVTYNNVPDGAFLPVQVVRVYSTGTTASNIIAETE